jgi:predicted RecA/RadA family phage recombinase
MKNHVQKGDNITVTATADALSGDVVKIGNLVGVAATDAAIGDSLDLVTVGVFDFPKVAADAITIGDAVYWRSSDGLVTGTASGNTKIGVAVTDAANPSGSVNVRLSANF